jgi:hypothetical protein
MRRIVGHGLHRQGDPVLDTDPRLPGWSGRALCNCGAQSPILTSNRQRKAWHRRHKADVLAATT